MNDYRNDIRKISDWMHARPWYLMCNLVLIYSGVFIIENYGLLQEAQGGLPLFDIWKGGLRYDSFAILITNTPYLLLALIPFYGKVQAAVARYSQKSQGLQTQRHVARNVTTFCTATEHRITD